MIRVFIADDSNIMRRAVRRLLSSEADIEVIGEASDYEEAMRLLPSQKPDVLVCDLRMPARPNFEHSVVAELAEACKCVVVAVSFAEIDVELEEAARKIGAFRVLDKTRLFDLLAPAIREAARTGKSSANA